MSRCYGLIGWQGFSEVHCASRFADVRDEQRSDFPFPKTAMPLGSRFTLAITFSDLSDNP
jgi:hypothetical protein